MPKYLLPCACGNSIAIEPSQAGQTVGCSCGKEVAAPSFREIKNLEPQPEADTRRPRGQWSPASGMIFVLGSVLVLTGLTTGGFAYFSRSLLARNLPVRSQEGIDEWLGEIDTSEAHDLIKIWNDTIETGFSEAEDSPWKLYREESGKYSIAIWVGTTACLIGLACAVGASLLRTPVPGTTKR